MIIYNFWNFNIDLKNNFSKVTISISTSLCVKVTRKFETNFESFEIWKFGSKISNLHKKCLWQPTGFGEKCHLRWEVQIITLWIFRRNFWDRKKKLDQFCSGPLGRGTYFENFFFHVLAKIFQSGYLAQFPFG